MTNNRRSSVKLKEFAKREESLSNGEEYMDSDDPALRAKDLKKAADETGIDGADDIDKSHKFPKVHDYGEKNASEFGE